MTVNELMVLMKAVRDRVNDLESLEKQVSVRERFFGTSEKTTEPMYSVSEVDKKLQELKKFLYHADVAIKISNARTNIDLKVDIDSLLDYLPEKGNIKPE
jgi:hypothetical protein